MQHDSEDLTTKPANDLVNKLDDTPANTLANTLANELKIIYRDDCLIAINKPSGLLVHRTQIDKHDHNNALHQLRDQTGLYLYPVHRLDKPTSGVLLFALNSENASFVAKQFEQHQVDKRYLGVVRGYTVGQQTIVHAVSDRDAPHKPKTPASTSYKTLAQLELPIQIDRYPTTRYSLLEIAPLSGRRHQIRQHMKHISNPLIGDSSYGKSSHNVFFRQHFNCHRLLLHAHSIRLTHPATGSICNITAENLDPSFQRVLAHEHWQWSGGQKSRVYLNTNCN